MENILALDYGEKRVGVAIYKGGFLFPKKHFDRASKDFWKNLITLIKNEHIKTILIGYPITLKGRKGRVASLVDEFVSTLQTQLPKDVEIKLVDERFTTKIAQETLQELYGKQYSVDSLSALELLRGYLRSEGIL